MKLYLSNSVNIIKKFANSIYVYTKTRNYLVAPPIQWLIDLYIAGISDFNVMLQLVKSEHKIEGSLDEIGNVFRSNSEFKTIFTFSKCENNVTVLGEYGKKFPYELHIELTNLCNLNCSHCYKKANEGTISYLNFDAFKNQILDVCIREINVVHLTGGEPTLHPNFKNIVEYLHEFFHIQITTNGANLWDIPISTIKKISDIDISMYGIDEKSYKENTGSLYAYYDFMKTCTLLKDNNIDFRINMIVNHKNISKLDDYVLKAIELGATSFSFGVPIRTGRLMEDTSSEWNCDGTMTKTIYRYMRGAKDKYKNKISIVEWERDVYSEKKSIFDCEYALPCKGGTFSWWMNEKMEFRPCAMIPEEYMLLKCNEWLDYCNNTLKLNWKDSYLKLEQYCSSKNTKLSEICYVFKKYGQRTDIN